MKTKSLVLGCFIAAILSTSALALTSEEPVTPAYVREHPKEWSVEVTKGKDGLKISFKDGRVDTYIVNLRNPQIAGATGGSTTVATADGQYSLTGRVGLHVDRTSGDSRVGTMDEAD